MNITESFEAASHSTLLEEDDRLQLVNAVGVYTNITPDEVRGLIIQAFNAGVHWREDRPSVLEVPMDEDLLFAFMRYLSRGEQA